MRAILIEYDPIMGARVVTILSFVIPEIISEYTTNNYDTVLKKIFPQESEESKKARRAFHSTRKYKNPAIKAYINNTRNR